MINMGVNSKRLTYEERKLLDAMQSGDINSYMWNDDYSSIVINFNGPNNTQYQDTEYTIDIVFPFEYPFKQPSGYFIGTAPDHPFYRFDIDDDKRRKRCTNLANTDFGLLYQRFSQQLTAAEYVKILKESLTPEGTRSMNDYMDSHGI